MEATIYIRDIGVISKRYICTVTRILWHTSMHAKTDIFTRNSGIAHERRSRRYCSEITRAPSLSREMFHWAFSRGIIFALARSLALDRIAFNRSHLYDGPIIIGTAAGVIKERRTRRSPGRGGGELFLATKRSTGVISLSRCVSSRNR